jgi:hypothetical protein
LPGRAKGVAVDASSHLGLRDAVWDYMKAADRLLDVEFYGL